MSHAVPILAGAIATLVFAGATLPMLAKAFLSKDLASYSSSNLVLANVGNGFYSIYVFHLPPGPIWGLHTFYVLSSALMLFWHRRYGSRRVHQPTHTPAAEMGRMPDATRRPRSLAWAAITEAPGRQP